MGNGPTYIHSTQDYYKTGTVPGVSFNAATNTLTLNNANIVASDSSGADGIFIACADFDTVTVVVNGSNSITANDDGILCFGGLKFTGSGSLTILSSNHGINAYSAVTFAGPTVSSRGQWYGVYGTKGVSITAGKVSAEGNSGSVMVSTNGKISNGVGNLGTIRGRLGYGAKFKSGGATYQVVDYGDIKLVKWGKGKTLNTKKCVSFGGYSDYRVVEIAAKACKGNKKLSKVVLGYSTKKIGKQAFAKCKKLKTLDVFSASSLLINWSKGKAPGIAKKAFTGAGIKKVKTGYLSTTYKNNVKKALVAKGLSKKAKIVK